MQKDRRTISKNTVIAILVAVILIILSTLALLYIREFTPKYQMEIEEYCTEYDVDKLLTFAIIKAESDYNPNAISPKGAVGLMQLLPSTASYILEQEVTTDMLLNPQFNLECGIKYLQYLFTKFDDINAVICAYNAGEGRVGKWMKDGIDLTNPPYMETRVYAKKVLSYINCYDVFY